LTIARTNNETLRLQNAEILATTLYTGDNLG
jgi:hypothetical protein